MTLSEEGRISAISLSRFREICKLVVSVLQTPPNDRGQLKINVSLYGEMGFTRFK